MYQDDNYENIQQPSRPIMPGHEEHEMTPMMGNMINPNMGMTNPLMGNAMNPMMQMNYSMFPWMFSMFNPMMSPCMGGTMTGMPMYYPFMYFPTTGYGISEDGYDNENEISQRYGRRRRNRFDFDDLFYYLYPLLRYDYDDFFYFYPNRRYWGGYNYW